MRLFRRLLNFLFGKKIEALELENFQLKRRSKYMPVGIYKGVHQDNILMAPELLDYVCKMAGDAYYVYFMFDIREQILALKDKKPYQIMAMLDALTLIDSNIGVYIKAYAESQRQVING